MVDVLNVLSNVLGNLLSRSTSPRMCPAATVPPRPPATDMAAADIALVAMINGVREQVAECYPRGEIGRAIGAAMALLHETNRYFDAAEPWALASSKGALWVVAADCIIHPHRPLRPVASLLPVLTSQRLPGLPRAHSWNHWTTRTTAAFSLRSRGTAASSSLPTRLRRTAPTGATGTRHVPHIRGATHRCARAAARHARGMENAMLAHMESCHDMLAHIESVPSLSIPPTHAPQATSLLFLLLLLVLLLIPRRRSP